MVSCAITSILRVSLNYFRLGLVSGLMHVNIILLSILDIYATCSYQGVVITTPWLLLHHGYYFTVAAIHMAIIASCLLLHRCYYYTVAAIHMAIITPWLL